MAALIDALGISMSGSTLCKVTGQVIKSATWSSHSSPSSLITLWAFSCYTAKYCSIDCRSKVLPLAMVTGSVIRSPLMRQRKWSGTNSDFRSSIASDSLILFISANRLFVSSLSSLETFWVMASLFSVLSFFFKSICICSCDFKSKPCCLRNSIFAARLSNIFVCMCTESGELKASALRR